MSIAVNKGSDVRHGVCIWATEGLQSVRDIGRVDAVELIQYSHRSESAFVELFGRSSGVEFEPDRPALLKVPSGLKDIIVTLTLAQLELDRSPVV